MSARAVVFWLLLAILVVVGLMHLGEIEHVLRLFRSLRWEWLLLAVTAQVLTYAVTVWAFQGLLAALGYRRRWLRLWEPTVAFVLGAQTVPLAGVGGLMLWNIGIGRQGVPQSAGLVAGILYSILDYVAFFVLLVIGLGLLFFRHALPAGLLGPLVVISAVLLGIGAAFAFLLRQERSGLAVVDAVVRFANRVLRRLRRPAIDAGEAHREAALFYETWAGLRSRHRQIWLPGLYIVAARCLDVFTLQILFVAVGDYMHWSVLTLGFVYASFASAVSFLPTGLGVLDASLALLYSSFGAPLSAAIVVTLLFRALAYWLPIPYALYLYHRVTAL